MATTKNDASSRGSTDETLDLIRQTSPALVNEYERLHNVYTLNTETLKTITKHFVSELTRGLKTDGDDRIPMVPTWCMSNPTSNEQGKFLAIDMGGTNLRVCEVTLLPTPGQYEVVQQKFRLREKINNGTADELWNEVAQVVQGFYEEHIKPKQKAGEIPRRIPLGFTFSYPVTQETIDHGVLQRWTKGLDIKGVENHDVVPQFMKAIEARNLPVKLVSLNGDTVGTLATAAYTDPLFKIGCIFGTGCNAAYMETCGNIPKLNHMHLNPNTPMSINTELGAFDNQRKVLPCNDYDIVIDKTSPRPGQQLYEKMVAGLYLGEQLRLIIFDLHSKSGCIFAGQSLDSIKEDYCLDSSVLSDLDTDESPNLETARATFQKFNLNPTTCEARFLKLVAELIITRAARLTACSIAAICIKCEWVDLPSSLTPKITTRTKPVVKVGADGSLFTKSPHFRLRQALALAHILDWDTSTPDKLGRGSDADPVQVRAVEDGSGVGAAIVAALTIQRVRDGVVAGVKDVQGILDLQV